MIVKFAGDSGDGMQLIGTIFSNVVSKMGYEVRTSPSYPADMRPTKNTEQGVSSFKVNFGEHISETGEEPDIVICMNQASYNVCLQEIKENTLVLYDEGCDIKDFHEKWLLPITEQCKTLNATKSRNIYVLGCLGYYLDIPQDLFLDEIHKKFVKKPEVNELNKCVLTASYNFCNNLVIDKHKIVYNSSKTTKNGMLSLLSGCDAVVKGIKKAADSINKEVFCASYPITPATNILVNFEAMRKQGVKAVQAEDEIAACCMSIGASYAGDIAVTSTSGPGMCLKSEAINLAVMAEIPLVIIDVMRGGPSTGMPTKTEQSDLNIALYGRSGDSPVPVIAATSPADCFIKGYEAVQMAVENCTPVILLMDASIGNGLEMTDLSQELPKIIVSEKWRIPGTDCVPIQLGGSEVDKSTMTISTNADNHLKNVCDRSSKIENIEVPEIEFNGCGDILLVGYGSYKGKLETIHNELEKQGIDTEWICLDHLFPLPKNIDHILGYNKIIFIQGCLDQLSNYLVRYTGNNNCYTYTNLSGDEINTKEFIENIKEIL